MKKEILLNILLIFAFVCFAFADEHEKCLESCSKIFRDCINLCKETTCFNGCEHGYDICIDKCHHSISSYSGSHFNTYQNQKLQEQLEQLQKERKIKEAQYQKCLDRCDQSYKRTRSFCNIGCFPATFSSVSDAYLICVGDCVKEAEKDRSECYQRCVLRHKY